MIRGALAALTTLAFAAPAAAEAFLHWPVDCTLGQDCYIEDYQDRDPGPEALDYACGFKTRDDHRGTDIAMNTSDPEDSARDVLAAADGVVAAIRDGEPDGAFENDPESIAGRECGNAVRIEHENGYQTLYCHLRRDSVVVAPGDQVTAGTVLGRIGRSGQSNFSHLHISVLDGDDRVDPFDAESAPETCAEPGRPTGLPPEETLWLDPLPYIASNLVTTGFSDAVPDFADVRSGAARKEAMAAEAPLVLYAYLQLAEPGDELAFEITAPGGETVFTGSDTLDDPQLSLFRAQGRRAPDGGWPTGRYVGKITLTRGDTLISMRETAVEIR